MFAFCLKQQIARKFFVNTKIVQEQQTEQFEQCQHWTSASWGRGKSPVKMSIQTSKHSNPLHGIKSKYHLLSYLLCSIRVGFLNFPAMLNPFRRSPWKLFFCPFGSVVNLKKISLEPFFAFHCGGGEVWYCLAFWSFNDTVVSFN